MELFDLHTHHLSKKDRTAIIQLPLSSSSIFSTPDFPFSYGIHPCQIKEENIDKLLIQIEAACHSNNYMLIGECGIDRLAPTSLELQEEVFYQQLKLAQKYKKPLLIHCVKAFDRIIAYLKKQPANPLPVIFHGYRGNPQITSQLLRQPNCYFSIGHYFNKESLQLIPKEQLFIESDESSQPINELYQQVAEIRQITFIQLLEQVNINKKRLFPLL